MSAFLVHCCISMRQALRPWLINRDETLPWLKYWCLLYEVADSGHSLSTFCHHYLQHREDPIRTFSDIQWSALGSDREAEVAPHHNCDSELDTAMSHTGFHGLTLKTASVCCVCMLTLFEHIFKRSNGPVYSIWYLYQYFSAGRLYN